MLLESVVIGHSMESVLYAFLNGHYHIQSTTFQPLFFEETPDFKLWRSNNKKHIWQKTKTCLGLLSRSIDYAEIEQIRVSENTIKIFSDNLLAEYEFEECFIYETLNVSHENDIVNPVPETFKVVDDFTVSRLGRALFHIDPIYTEDILLSEIYFYNSMRVDGSKTVTDIATVSYLSKEQLYFFDYSDTIASFKLKSCLNSWGYMGLRDKGRYKNGSAIYKKPILDHVKRHIIPVDKNKYKDTKKVKFINFTIEELFHAPST